ncbi:hypothetical protein [Elizabethkingia meningoseptica]|uniref:hypothetical protein n=1 Tax=Elizabethkingia meningoseptica TaxID=238 RepID=UPI002DD6FC95|nr:hypothetical protein [Elizabethkingia meningoseptica]
MRFKLLAIRPFADCNPQLLKNLRIKELYQFYNDYKFSFNNGKVTTIEYRPSIPENLYNISDSNKVNISAIVGKNGSGKSALMDLLVAAIVQISLLFDEDFIKEDEIFNNNEEILKERFRDSISNDLGSLHLELFYLSPMEEYFRKENGVLEKKLNNKKTKIRRIVLNGQSLFFQDYKPRKKVYSNINEEIFVKDDIINSKEEKSFLKDFFYSIVINYSHYAFNKKEIGEWINGVFQKNDGYQLPVVINPYRTNGNIDINTEKDLTVSRFLVNVLQEDGLRVISNDKPKIKFIKIELNKSKFFFRDGKFESRILNSETEKEKIIELLAREFGLKFLNTIRKKFFYQFTLEYILSKLQKITHYLVYRKYEKCFNRETKKQKNGELYYAFKILNDSLFAEYIKELSNDFSHNSYKLRQALHFLIYPYLEKNEVEKVISLDQLSKNIYSSFRKKNDNNFTKTEIHFFGQEFSVNESLPSFFNCEFLFSKENLAYGFNSLSSGEKQKIFSVHSVLYHLRNLRSVKESKYLHNGKEKFIVSYDSINIIFDEIELYFHPEFQKSFIHDFLQSLSALKMNGLPYINLIFLTHSPFILSDIPRQNILKLKDGKPELNDENNLNSFGANIHDLLADEFFIGHETMGTFASNKIDEVIKYLYLKLKIKDIYLDIEKYNYLEPTKKSLKAAIKELEKELKTVINYNEKEILEFINIIGEPLIKNKMSEMTKAIFD